MNVLFLGDACCASGFARCTHAVCDALYNRGHNVTVLGLNYYGDPHLYPYSIYPCVNPLDDGTDAFGVGRLPHLVTRLDIDVLILLSDPWNIGPYLRSLKKSIDSDTYSSLIKIAWVAVDGRNVDGADCNELDLLVTWTNFAMKELRQGGYTGEGAIVPLGVDLDVFSPVHQAEARASIYSSTDGGRNLPTDAFIVGVVGRNQLRKRLDLTIESFAKWVHKCDVPNAFLHLHVAPTGEQACNISVLARYYGVLERLIEYRSNNSKGIADTSLRNLYSSFDIYLSTTQGEGWGLPCMEAMACGVPCLVPKYSGLGEWPGDAVGYIETTSQALTAPLNGAAYTLGGVVSAERAAYLLNALYVDIDRRRVLSLKGLELVRQDQYRWSDIGDCFVSNVHSAISSKRVAELLVGTG